MIYRNQTLALKIIKNVSKYREAAKFEIEVLKTIDRRDPNSKKYKSLFIYLYFLFY